MTLEANADQKTPTPGAGEQETDKTTGTTANGDNNGGADDVGMLGAGGDDGRQITTPATWPDDWRAKLSGGDEKISKRLERFTDPAKVVQSWLAAEQKISSGDYKKALPENATDEQKAEWRKANGLPETPDKYELPKIDGREWGEADMPSIDRLRAAMHAVDAPPSAVQAALSVYAALEADGAQQAQAERYESDRAFLSEQDDLLRAKHGNEYRPMANIYDRYLNDTEVVSPSVKDVIMGARGPDGNFLRNNAEFFEFMVGRGLEKYGEGAMISGDAKSSLESREAEIRQIMKTDFSRYTSEGLDKELLKIMERKSGRRA